MELCVAPRTTHEKKTCDFYNAKRALYKWAYRQKGSTLSKAHLFYKHFWATEKNQLLP
jgi:spore germination cell wall hydrolase CwlJ-like protein